MEAREENEASDDEWEAEYQEAVALVTSVKQRRGRETSVLWRPQGPSSTSSSRNSHVRDVDNWVNERESLLCGQSEEGQLGGWVQQVSRCIGLSQFGELETLVSLQESLSHNFELENSTCVADVCFYEPNLDDSVVSDCDDTHMRTGDASPASCTPGSVLGVGDTKQTFLGLPEGVVSGTPACLAALAIFSTEH